MAIPTIGPVSLPIKWDTDEDLMERQRQITLRGRVAHVSPALLAWMNAQWGGMATAVKTATNVETGDVIVAKANPGDKGAVAIRLMGTHNTGEFSFHRPLVKLGIRVPVNRQFVVTPYTRTVEGHGTVFILPVAKRISLPRGSRETAGQPVTEPEETPATMLGSALKSVAVAADPVPEADQ